MACNSVVDKLTSTKQGRKVMKVLMEGCCMKSDEYWKERSELKWN